MKTLHVQPQGEFSVVVDEIATDKSISHRCAIFSLLSDKPSLIKGYLRAEDTLNTLRIVQSLGAIIEDDGESIKITPPSELKEPDGILDCGNSGTAMRLLMGFLSSQDGFFVLHGDRYLASRPMRRVADPLRNIGAIVDGRVGGNLSPISVRGQKLNPFSYISPIASAQVKSALVLASLKCDGASSIIEPELSRDHTERMLEGMGLYIKRDGLKITIYPPQDKLRPLNITIPSDPSSAFFFALSAVIVPNSSVVLKNILLNKTRIEAFRVLERMGAKISYELKDEEYESVGDITVSYAPLHGVEVSENIAWLIDEIPALGVAFACAKGKSVVRNAKELRVKESDRISSVVKNLRLCGIEVEEFEDGFEVVGGELKPATIDSFGDHRIAMSFAIAGLKCGMVVKDSECIATSFPNFVEILSSIGSVDED